MQVERMDGASGVAKATETARTERPAMKTGGKGIAKFLQTRFGLETENSLGLGACACVAYAQKAIRLLSSVCVLVTIHPQIYEPFLAAEHKYGT